MPITRKETSYWSHETAIIDPGAVIGPGTRVWHFSHVCGTEVVIGANCSFGQNVYVGPRVKVGNGCRVQNNVSIYDLVELEDYVFCGPSAVFTNVINPRAHIPRKDEYRKTRVGRGASLGANCTILCGVEIGRFAFVAAGAVVTQNVPAFALVKGVPAVRGGWICHCGLKLQASSDPVSSGAASWPGTHPETVSCAACGSEYQVDETSCRPLKLINCFDEVLERV